MSSRKPDNRTLVRKLASDEHDNPIPKKVFKKPGSAVVVVERLQDTSSYRKVSSTGGATHSKSRRGGGSKFSKHRKTKDTTPESSSSSSSEEEEEQENGSDNEKEEKAESSSEEDDDEKHREKNSKEKQNKHKPNHDESRYHKSSSGSSNINKHEVVEPVKDEKRRVKTTGNSKKNTTGPPKKTEVTTAMSETRSAVMNLIAINKHHCDSLDAGGIENEEMDYEDVDDVRTKTPSPGSREPLFKKITKGMKVDDYQPAEEQNGDDAANCSSDSDGDGDAGNESDGTAVLDEHAENDDMKHQEVVTANVHRSGSVSPPQQREKSSNSSHILVEENSYEKYSNEIYSKKWERWCYTRLPGGKKAMLYDVDGTHLHGKIPSVLDIHVIDTDPSVAHNDYKKKFYKASKVWVKLLMTSLRELSECNLDINYHKLFSITDVNDPRNLFYGRAMGSDETVFSIVEDVFNNIGVNEKIHADVSLHEFSQCVDLVHFEQDRSADEKTENRIKKLADDNNSDAFITGSLGYLCQSINVDKEITKKQYESMISYFDGLFVLPVKYQGYIFPDVSFMNDYSDPTDRMNASFDLNECNPMAIEVLIILETILLLHNFLYPLMNYDEKWIQLTSQLYNELRLLQQECVRAPSSIDYQIRMMNLLDEVIEFEHSRTKENKSHRQDRHVKQSFNLLVELYSMNRIMTLSYSHEARCVRGENLLAQDRDMVVYNILVKFLSFEERVKEVSLKDSGLQDLLRQWSGTVCTNGDSKAAPGGKQQTIQQLRLKLPTYFSDVILKHFMNP